MVMVLNQSSNIYNKVNNHRSTRNVSSLHNFISFSYHGIYNKEINLYGRKNEVWYGDSFTKKWGGSHPRL